MLLSLSLLLLAELSGATSPRQADVRWQNVMETGACPDGSKIRAELLQVGTKLSWVRKACRDLVKPEAFVLPTEVPNVHALESPFVEGGRLFAREYDKELSPMVLCRSEADSKLESKPKASVVRVTLDGQKPPHLAMLLIAPDLRAGTAVVASVEGRRYHGKDELNPLEHVTLEFKDDGRAEASFRFERSTGKCKKGQCPVLEGTAKNLRCYRH